MPLFQNLQSDLISELILDAKWHLNMSDPLIVAYYIPKVSHHTKRYVYDSDTYIPPRDGGGADGGVK